MNALMSAFEIAFFVCVFLLGFGIGWMTAEAVMK